MFLSNEHKVLKGVHALGVKSAFRYYQEKVIAQCCRPETSYWKKCGNCRNYKFDNPVKLGHKCIAEQKMNGSGAKRRRRRKFCSPRKHGEEFVVLFFWILFPARVA